MKDNPKPLTSLQTSCKQIFRLFDISYKWLVLLRRIRLEPLSNNSYKTHNSLCGNCYPWLATTDHLWLPTMECKPIDHVLRFLNITDYLVFVVIRLDPFIVDSSLECHVIRHCNNVLSWLMYCIIWFFRQSKRAVLVQILLPTLR